MPAPPPLPPSRLSRLTAGAIARSRRADTTSASRFRSRHRLARPFLLSTLLITLFATYALFVRDPLEYRQVDAVPGALLQHRSGPDRHVVAQLSSSSPSSPSSSLQTGPVADSKKECGAVRGAKDQCSFVRAHCADDEAGLIPYLTLYYCGFGGVSVATAAAARPVTFAVLTVWLGLLFTTIGIAASDFFSVNLSTIASALGLSQSLAGVTFLAFGNGSPDVFSTFAAMGSHSGSMAVGELIGAASFITAVVAGSMALVREFKVSRHSFVRDTCFFIVAVSFAIFVLADGRLHLWESCCMIAFYFFYVLVVVGGHWLTNRRRRRNGSRMLSHASHPHMVGAPESPSEPLEPYRDGESPEIGVVPSMRVHSWGSDGAGGRDRSPSGQVLPRVEIEGLGITSTAEDEDRRGMQNVVEVTSHMRANRPRWRRSNTTITPIRPSLVGALEFRAVMASLQKARNLDMRPLTARMYSDISSSHSTSHLDQAMPASLEPPSAASADPTSRDRALSSGCPPLHLRNNDLLLPERWGDRTGPTHTDLSTEAASPAPARGRRPTTPRDTAPALPPHRLEPSRFQEPPRVQEPPPHLQGPPRLQIPSHRRNVSEQSSPSVSAFPHFTDSPGMITPTPTSPLMTRPNPFESAPIAQHPSSSYFDQPKPTRWWPYSVLPPPHILFGTLFPTLQGWKEKTLWDKAISLISVPSIFLLTVTLPVVENEIADDDDGDDGKDGGGGGDKNKTCSNSLLIVDQSEHQQVGSTAGLVPSVEHGRAASATIEAEIPWQEYRRESRSGILDASLSPRSGPKPPLMDLTPSFVVSGPSPRRTLADLAPGTGSVDAPANQPLKRSISSADPDSPGWSRWLVALQILTGPPFVAFILWANMHEDVEQPGRLLLQMFLYSLVISLCLLLVLLLTTTADRKPKLHYLLCFMGFIISVAWISTVAGEVVGVLKAFGVILGISEAILGLTIFAVGNSLGDLVADVTVARLGFPVMALAACFGGPMLNILLGIGIGGAWMITQSANKAHRKHPDRPLVYEPYHLQVGGTLIVSAVTVLVTLFALLIAVPANRWVMSRKIGWSLIALWSVSTTLNLVLEMTGWWRAPIS